MEQNNLELLKNEMVRYSALLVTNNDKGNGSECNFQQNISKCCVDFYYVLLNAFVYLIWKLKNRAVSFPQRLCSCILVICIVSLPLCFKDEE